MVSGIVTANSREEDETYREFSENLTKVIFSKEHDFADRKSMPYFWARRNLRQPEEKALAFAYSFMGIRIQCAQCHKHPFDQWTQDDYNQFTKFFTRVQFGRNPETNDEYREMMKALGVDELRGGGTTPGTGQTRQTGQGCSDSGNLCSPNSRQCQK